MDPAQIQFLNQCWFKAVQRWASLQMIVKCFVPWGTFGATMVQESDFEGWAKLWAKAALQAVRSFL